MFQKKLPFIFIFEKLSMKSSSQLHAVLFHISILHTAPKIVAKLNLALSSYINIHLVKMAARGKRDSVEVELGSRASNERALHSVQKMLKLV